MHFFFLCRNYRCFGLGFVPSKRVKWAKVLKDKEVEQFLMHSFIDPEPQKPWLAQKMALRIPYSAQELCLGHLRHGCDSKCKTKIKYKF